MEIIINKEIFISAALDTLHPVFHCNKPSDIPNLI